MKTIKKEYCLTQTYLSTYFIIVTYYYLVILSTIDYRHKTALN